MQGLTGHTHLFHAVLEEMELTCDAWSGPARAALASTTDASAHYVREDPSHAFSMCAELVKLAQTLLASVRAGVQHTAAVHACTTKGNPCALEWGLPLRELPKTSSVAAAHDGVLVCRNAQPCLLPLPLPFCYRTPTWRPWSLSA